MATVSRFCKHCDAQRACETKEVNHVLHLLLAIFCLVGFITWPIAVLTTGNAARCRTCGTRC